MAHAAIFSSVISSGSQRSFWSRVPRLMIVAAPRPRLTPTVLSNPMLTPASSDTSTAAIDAWVPKSPKPADDRFSESARPARSRSLSSIVFTGSAASTPKPNSLNSLRAIGYGELSPVSNASRCGRISLSMNPRTVSRMIRSVSDHSNIICFWLLRQPGGDVVDVPGTVGLDGLDVVPSGERRNRAALNGIHPAGDRAFLRGEVRHQRRDVRRTEQIELAILGFGHQRTHPGGGQGEPGAGDGCDRVDPHAVPFQFLGGTQGQPGDSRS